MSVRFHFSIGARLVLLAFSSTVAACSGDGSVTPDPMGVLADGGDAEPSEDATREAALDAKVDRADARRDEGVPRPDTAGFDVVGPSNEAQSDAVDAGLVALCTRLRDPMRPNYITQLSEQVDKEYVTRVYRDCNVSKMARSDLDTIFEFYNDLFLFSLDLWGCTMENVSSFGLMRSNVTDLTSADAARLIDHYIGAATSILRLDTVESSRMREDLTRLSALAITRQSEAFALSMCGLDAGVDVEGGDEAEGGDQAEGGGDASAGGDAANDAGGSE